MNLSLARLASRTSRRLSPVALSLSLTLGVAAGAATLLAPEVAMAGDPVLAKKLFDEGRTLMEAGKLDEAVQKFLASNRADASVGAMYNAGRCYEQLGKLASAWGAYNEAARFARGKGDQREQEAVNAGKALEGKLSELTITAKEKVPGLVVKRDGTELDVAALGTGIPVDAGEHVVEASAPGYKPVKLKISVGGNADKKALELPALEKAPEGTPGAGEPGAAKSSGTLRTVGFVVGGVGLVATGVGIAMGALAASDASTAENDPSLCPNKQCSAAGRAFVNDATTKATVSSVLIPVGVVALAGGVILAVVGGPKGGAAKTGLRGPAGSRWLAAPYASPEGGGLGLVGQF